MPIPAIFVALANAGLGLLGNAVLAKGKEVVEKELGVKIPDSPEGLTPDVKLALMQAQHKHEEFLVEAGLRGQAMLIEADKAAQGQVTDRWKADMASDSWLSKNIRPMALLWVVGLVTVMVVADVAGAHFQTRITDLIETCLQLILGAYFVGRTVEKGISIWKGKGNGTG